VSPETPADSRGFYHRQKVDKFIIFVICTKESVVLYRK